MQTRKIDELVLRNVQVRMSWRPRGPVLAAASVDFGRTMVAAELITAVGTFPSTAKCCVMSDMCDHHPQLLLDVCIVLHC